MATYVPAKVSTQFIFFASLVSQANTKIMQVNPTIASGDFKVSIDGGALANLATLPTVTPAGGSMVKFTLSTAEMAGANATVVCLDAAGSEWCDLTINIPTAARQIDDLAYPATSGRSMVVDAAGLVDANVVKLGPTGAGTAQTAKDVGGAVPAAAAGASGGLLISGSNSGTTTLGALTVTGATTHTGNMVLSDGLTVSAPSTANRAGITVTGNGTGAGVSITGGNGATGNALDAIAASTNGKGINATGIGTGAGIVATGGVTGHGISAVGGTTSGDGVSAAAATSGHGITATGVGTTKHGVNATGGSTTSHGISATGGGVGHGILATSGGGATGDGIKALAVSTNGSGIYAQGVGNLDGILAWAGATGNGLEGIGGATSGDGFFAQANGNGNGFRVVAVGTGKHGILAQGGATTGAGIRVVGGSTSGDGISVVTTSGHGINLAPAGSSKHGIFATGGNAGTSDGINAVAGSGGVDIRGNITGNLVGTVSTLTTYTGNTVQTGDSFARIGVAGAGLTNIDLPNQTMDIIGNITGNLSGSVGSIGVGGIASTTFAAGAIDAAAIAANAIGASEIATDAIDADALAADAVTEIWAKTLAELAQAAPSGTPAVLDAIAMLYMMARNQVTVSATDKKFTNDAGTVVFKKALSDSGSVYTEAEAASGP